MTTTTPSQSLSSRPLRAGIESSLVQLLGSPINPDRSNSGKQLWNVYFWQVVAELAEAREKAAWESVQGSDGLVDDDEALRALTIGEHIAAESNKFSVLVKVSTPRKNLDRDKMVQELARKFRIASDKIEAVIEKCKVPGKASLQKRIVELE